jgi:hypothetical protein
MRLRRKKAAMQTLAAMMTRDWTKTSVYLSFESEQNSLAIV